MQIRHGIEGDPFDQVARRTGRKRAEVMEAWDERAAIREYLGGFTRLEAELHAFRDIESMLAVRTDGLPNPRRP